MHIEYIMKTTNNLSLKVPAAVLDPACVSISLITKGVKIIHDGRRTIAAEAGTLLYTPAGHHNVAPEPFEETTMTFAPGEIRRIIELLSSNNGLKIERHQKCPSCTEGKHAAYPAWRAVRTYFASLAPYMRDTPPPIVETLKKMELIALIASNSDCCLQRRMLEDSDAAGENFEAIMRDHILVHHTIDDLAQKTNRSPTAFKAEFKRRYKESPHAWMTRQRLAHARTLLITTSLPILEIALQCAYPNQSHFIKLFGKEYGITPAVYRKRGA